MTGSHVKQFLAAAFQHAPRPSQAEITSHACSECFRVRDDFAPYTSLSVPGENLEYHWDSLPLFTPQAFRYFLPGFMTHMFNHPDSPLVGGVLERLQDLARPDSFWGARAILLSESERGAIREFLRFVYEDPSFASHCADSFDALVLWGEHPNPSFKGTPNGAP